MTLQFEPINIEKQRDYLELFEKCDQKASDYSFVNLWGWADEYGLMWAWDESLVWIKQTKPETLFWAPIGLWKDKNWKNILEAKFSAPAVFIRIPEGLTEIWKNYSKGITVEDTRGHWDYLYSIDELVELKGNRFHKKKNLLSQFIKAYKYDYIPLSHDIVEKALSMQDDWCTWRDCEASETLSSENRVIEKVLRAWHKLPGLKGGAVVVDDKIAAYTIAESLSDDTLLIHFEKGNQDYKGAYQAINQIFLEHNRNGFKTVNREQDLDDEGLRKAKLSYNPVGFIKKYKIVVS
ncbi:MAG: phosphatidylglycerol lysyltransferase domain-containing protein [Desulfobacterales bacterium]